MRRASFILAVVLTLFPLVGLAQTDPASLPFRNPDLPTEQRIDDLLGRLTLEEKVSLMIDRAKAIDRLGIPPFPWWNEALHGVARAGRATVFPQAIGLAATWDTGLMQRVATAISDEARAMNNRALSRGEHHLYQGLTFWSPNINIFRDPRWGRGQETYGEDPTLTGALAVAFVKGMQGNDPRYLKTIATPKHFAVHSGPEPDRHTFDARVSETDLRETYLPAFRAAVMDGHAGSVMCAYNSVRGLPACANDELLGTILRGQWKFDGYVVSDCGAIDDIYERHKTRPTQPEAAALALKAGTDLECGAGSWSPGSPDTYLTLTDAVKRGLATERDVDTALGRLIRAEMRLGIYDPPDRVPYTKLTYDTVVNSPAHRELALESARKSIVLLKNDNRTLPLRKDLRSIAVIGPNADELDVLLGNYNGTPVAPVTVLNGIRKAAGAGTNVIDAHGAPLAAGLPNLQPVPADVLSTTTADGKSTQGLTAAYYRGHFDGAPVLTRTDSTIAFDWADRAPVEGISGEGFSVRWTGTITPKVTGRYTLGFRGATMFRVFIDEHLIAQARTDHEPNIATGQVTLRAGWSYPIRVEYEHEKYDAVGSLLWQPPGAPRDELPEAVAAAQRADAVVLVLGLSPRLEGEEMSLKIDGFAGGDRTSLDLPATEQALMEKIVATAAGKPVVLVLLSGSAVAVNWADKNVPAIVQAWYPGEAGGTAVADVLFGNANPGGRLPVTFYRSIDQLPPFSDYAMKGRTYRYFTGAPLYPFGHGLSYTRFTYSNPRIPATGDTSAPVEIAVDVQNAGGIAGDEVVQVYLRALDAGADAPVRALKAFTRVTLASGEKKTVTFTLSPRDFSFVHADGNRVVQPGRFTVAIGGKQPGLKGTADAATTEVVTGTVTLTGTPQTLPK